MCILFHGHTLELLLDVNLEVITGMHIHPSYRLYIQALLSPEGGPNSAWRVKSFLAVAGQRYQRWEVHNLLHA